MSANNLYCHCEECEPSGLSRTRQNPRYNADGGDQEAAYCDAVAAIITADPAEFIIDTWLDEFKLVDDRAAKTAAERLTHLRQVMLFALRSICTELEMAENAARMEGGQSFSEWLEERS